MNTDFQTLADIRKWLIQFRTVIYTKDRRMDLELMEEEVKGAHEAGLMDNKDYTAALMIIKNEYSRLCDQDKEG